MCWAVTSELAFEARSSATGSPLASIAVARAFVALEHRAIDAVARVPESKRLPSVPS
jgi:hypothetical protein